MAAIALCPHCRQAITVPIDVIADQRFLCPLCAAEFAVQDAVVTASELPAAQPATSSSAEPTSSRRLQVEFVSDTAERRAALPSATLRRRSRQSNWLGQLIGIVGGGMIGLSIGYCILLRLRGQEADFLQIADRLPTWATGLPPQLESETPGERPEPNVERAADESDLDEEVVAE